MRTSHAIVNDIVEIRFQRYANEDDFYLSIKPCSGKVIPEKVALLLVMLFDQKQDPRSSKIIADSKNVMCAGLIGMLDIKTLSHANEPRNTIAFCFQNTIYLKSFGILPDSEEACLVSAIRTQLLQEIRVISKSMDEFEMIIREKVWSIMIEALKSIYDEIILKKKISKQSKVIAHKLVERSLPDQQLLSGNRYALLSNSDSMLETDLVCNPAAYNQPRPKNKIKKNTKNVFFPRAEVESAKPQAVVEATQLSSIKSRCIVM